MRFRDMLRMQLRIDEGVRRFPYDDATGKPPVSKGKITIGIGRNLTDVGLRPDEMALMLENDIAEAERAARRLVPNFDELTEVRKYVVCNMAFNMGEAVFSGFRQTLRAIREHRYSDAARGMRRSKWATQVGARAERLARQMEGE